MSDRKRRSGFFLVSWLPRLTAALSRNWRQTSPLTRRLVVWVGGAYLILLGTALYQPLLKSILPIPEFTEPDMTNFWLSFHASLWEDLISFGLLGLAALVISMRQPQDDFLATRLWFLFSSPNCTESARDHALEVVTRLAGFVSDGSIDINVLEFNSSLGAFRVECRTKYKYKNMLKDRLYEDSDSFVSIVADDVSPPDGIFGKVASVSFRPANGTNIEYVKHETALTQTHSKIPAPLRIEQNSEADFAYSYWIWQKSGDDYWISAKRYSEHCKLTIRNCTDIPLNISKIRYVLSDKDSSQPIHDAIKLEPKGEALVAESATFWQDRKIAFTIEPTPASSPQPRAPTS